MIKTIASVLLIGFVAVSAYGQDIPDAPQPQPKPQSIVHPNFAQSWPKRAATWPKRHPLATTMLLLGAGTAIFLYETRPHSCPKYIDGVSYDGTPPCPKSCESDGCYWGPK